MRVLDVVHHSTHEDTWHCGTPIHLVSPLTIHVYWWRWWHQVAHWGCPHMMASFCKMTRSSHIHASSSSLSGLSRLTMQVWANCHNNISSTWTPWWSKFSLGFSCCPWASILHILCLKLNRTEMTASLSQCLASIWSSTVSMENHGWMGIQADLDIPVINKQM